MVKSAVILIALATVISAQDDVQVDCTPDHMEIRVTKAVVDTMGFASSDVHLLDDGCTFGQEENDQFYIYRMSPLTACGTEVKLNDTYVEYKNKLIAGTEGESPLEKGAIVVGTADSVGRQTLAAKLKCLFPVELMVSTAFLPNISHVTIPLPPAFGVGKFMATMLLFKGDDYLESYQANPQLSTGDFLNVGVQLQGDFTDDIFIRMQRCWATPVEEADADTSFDLISDGCGAPSATSQGLEVTINGDQTYGRFQAPVFKFVQYTAVWLHCDLQICIRDTCQPQCDSNGRRRRRAGNHGYGPQDWEESHLISIGPLRRNHEIPSTIEIIEETEEIELEETPVFTPFHVAVLSALIAVSALCVTLACFLCKKPTKQ